MRARAVARRSARRHPQRSTGGKSRMTSSTAVQSAQSTWRLDPTHSSVEFSVKHMMMTTVRGRFKEVRGTLTADEEHPEGCCAEVEIQAASIDTGSPDRDAHLRGPDFFDATRY